MLTLVPAFQRQLGQYVNEADTESKLAAYLADAVQALMFRWDRSYSVTWEEPLTFTVEPDIAQKDIRPIVLMASIIYKMANTALAAFQDGDFSYNPHKGPANTLEIDRTELLNYLGKVRLAGPTSAPLNGYGFAWSGESYSNLIVGGWISDGWLRTWGV
jgi:hypothetical protein